MISLRINTPQPVPDTSPGAAQPGRGRILIVDPDESYLAFASEVLHSFRPGYAVTTARTVVAAQQWLSSITPDLVLACLPPHSETTHQLAQAVGERTAGSCGIVYLATDQAQRTAEQRLADHRRPENLYPKPTTLHDLLTLVRRLMRS